jgi:hypothetical protein
VKYAKGATEGCLGHLGGGALQATPQRHQEPGGSVTLRTDPRKRSGHRRSKGTQRSGDPMFADESLGAVDVGSYLGDDLVGPKPDDGVVGLLDHQGIIDGDAQCRAISTPARQAGVTTNAGHVGELR